MANPSAVSAKSTTHLRFEPAVSNRARDESDSLDQCMERFLDGDARAFEELYQALAPRLVQSLRILSGDAALAEDLTQITFLKVLRASDTYRRGMSVRAWIWTIAKHTYLDERRRGFRTREIASGDLTPEVEPSATHPSSSRTAAVARALGALPTAQREAILLLKVHELSAKEAAAAAGTSVGAIKMRAQRAYETLRRLLGSEVKR
jgi:RNA polymerase sigma-70 factor (ECF subfamily)